MLYITIETLKSLCKKWINLKRKVWVKNTDVSFGTYRYTKEFFNAMTREAYFIICCKFINVKCDMTDPYKRRLNLLEKMCEKNGDITSSCKKYVGNGKRGNYELTYKKDETYSDARISDIPPKAYWSGVTIPKF